MHQNAFVSLHILVTHIHIRAHVHLSSGLDLFYFAWFDPSRIKRFNDTRYYISSMKIDDLLLQICNGGANCEKHCYG